MRQTPLKRMSDERRKQAPARQRVQAATLKRAGYRCEAAGLVPEVECRGGLDTDEIVLRSAVKDAHLEPGNTQALCRAHHDWKHDNPDEAERRGLYVRAHDIDDIAEARSVAAGIQAAWLAG